MNIIKCQSFHLLIHVHVGHLVVCIVRSQEDYCHSLFCNIDTTHPSCLNLSLLGLLSLITTVCSAIWYRLSQSIEYKILLFTTHFR